MAGAIARPSRIVEIRWRRSSVGEFRLPVEADGPGCWTIHERLGSGELHREGVAMHHCMVWYTTSLARACARGEISIWSMRFEVAGRRHRTLTIKVDMATRTICDARRHGDARPNARLRSILELWARQEGLKIGC